MQVGTCSTVYNTAGGQQPAQQAGSPQGVLCCAYSTQKGRRKGRKKRFMGCCNCIEGYYLYKLPFIVLHCVENAKRLLTGTYSTVGNAAGWQQPAWQAGSAPGGDMQRCGPCSRWAAAQMGPPSAGTARLPACSTCLCLG